MSRFERASDDSLDQTRELVRHTLRERVAAPPAVEAVADRAIAGATRIRRGRSAFSGIAAATSVVLVAIAVASYNDAPVPSDSLPGGPSATWQPTEVLGELPVDVAVDRYVYLAAGGVKSLAPVLPASCEGGACIRGVWRVSDGHLVSVHDADATVGASVLWHVPDFGSSTVVVDGGGALVVSTGTEQRPGAQVAWVDDGRLHVGTYADAIGEVSDVISTPAPEVDVAELIPRAVVSDAVVLSGTYPTSAGDIWDVWFPDRGDYRPAQYPVIGLHGTTVDGERIIGWFRSEEDGHARCLGELVPEEFVPDRSVCPSPFTLDARILPSPDGRWWIVADRIPAAGRVQPGLALYDAEQVWNGADPVRTWSEAGSSFDGVWLDLDTFVAVDRSTGTVLTLHPDGRPDETMELSTPGPTANVSVVVDLR